MKSLHRGDRVKLTEAGAKIQAHSYRRFARGYVESERFAKWRNRCGTVTNTPLPSSAGVSVLWDGLIAPSNYPKGMVEPLKEDAQ